MHSYPMESIKRRTFGATSGALVMALTLSITPIDGKSPTALASQVLAVITNPILRTDQGATFTAQIRCIGRINHPPFGVNLKVQTDEGLVYVPWFTPSWDQSEYAADSSYNQQGFRDFEISWVLDRQNLSDMGVPGFQINRLLSSKEWRVSASTTSCDNTDLTGDGPWQVYNQYHSSQERTFDGPRVMFGAKSLAVRQGTYPEELVTMTHTFHGGTKSLREGEDSLFSVEPVCTVRDNDDEILTNTEIAQLESGASREIRCEGGTLKSSEAWRADSFVGGERWGAGRLHIIGESQWTLAADHFSNFKDDLGFTYSEVPLVLPAGASDAVYVLSEPGEGEPEIESESRMHIGALVGSSGKSLSTEFSCYVNRGSAVATSPTARIAVGAGMTGTGSYGDAELVRFSFNEEDARCDFTFSERVGSPIRSLLIEDANNVLALHGTASDTISRITFPDTEADPDSEYRPAPQQDFTFAANLQLQKLVTDSEGQVWGVSQAAGEIKIWKLTLVPPALSNSQPGPIFSEASSSVHGFTAADNGEEEVQEAEPPVGTVNAEAWLQFQDDNELLVGFEARGNILTVSTRDDYSWSYFTSVRSFDSTDRSKVTAQMQSNPGEDCVEFFGFEESCGGYLLGVDAVNGVAMLSDRGDLGRSGPSTSSPLRQLDDRWALFGSNSSNRGTLSNDGRHAWLFNSDDATFERVALELPQNLIPTEGSNDSSSVATYFGPIIDRVQTDVRIGSELVLRGQGLGTISSLKIGEVTQTLTSKSDTELKFTIDASTKLGLNDIVLVSSFGTLTLQSHLRILSAKSREDLTKSVKSPLIGTTKILSKSDTKNLRWFKLKLNGSGVKRILCTALVDRNASQRQQQAAMALARTTCSQASSFLETPNVGVRVRTTSTPKMPGRVMISFKG